MDALYLKQLELGPMQNFVYLVGDMSTREALIVDPAWNIEEALALAKQDGFKVMGAMVTHTHFDHINSLEHVLDETDGKVYIHQDEAEYLKGMKQNIKPVRGSDKIKIGQTEIEFVHTPGHTPGSQCFLVNQDHLISGDTLFINACGRCDLPGGDVSQMYTSLKRLGQLKASTLLYPGHNYADTKTSTIEIENQQNPYMQLGSLDDFIGFRMH